MSAVANPILSSPLAVNEEKASDIVAHDLEQQLKSEPSIEALVAEYQKSLEKKEPHIGYIITDFESKHEQHHDNLVNKKMDEIKVYQTKVNSINTLLAVLGEELADPSKTKIDLTHHAVLLGSLSKQYPENKLLQKNTLTRSEAEGLEKAFSRYLQTESQMISHELTRLTRLVEEKYQNLKTFQEIIRMLREMMQNIVRNQKA